MTAPRAVVQALSTGRSVGRHESGMPGGRGGVPHAGPAARGDRDLDGDRSVDVLRETSLAALARLAKAACGDVDRTEFLPYAAREATTLLGARACEVWLDDDGLVLSASFRTPDAPTTSPGPSALKQAFSGQVSVSEGWLCLPVGREAERSGALALHRDEVWPPDDLAWAEVAAVLIGLALAAESAGRLDAEARDQFLALVGHDLRSPLSNVRVGAQLAVRNLEAGDIDSVRQALEIIENQSGRLVQRLEALLEAVAAQGGQLLRQEPLDLGALAESVIEPFRLAALDSADETSFEVVVDADAPLARGDEGQIRKVVEVLVDNAAKYAAGGQIVVHVSADGRSARLDVCDDGPGIRPQDVDRVFAPFGRGSASAGKEGFGLGLYLARNIITAHNGRLWLARTSRSGTCIAFSLPAVEPDER